MIDSKKKRPAPFKAAARRGVKASPMDLINTGTLAGTGEVGSEGTLPLVVEAKGRDFDPLAWVASCRDFVEEKLAEHGGLLFRDFGLSSVDKFRAFVAALTPEVVNYVEGSSPRVQLGDKVYTSTEYPPEETVSMHSELSYAHRWPRKIFFYCETAPGEGGETPIADNRKVLERLPEALVSSFEERGVCYLRNLRSGSGAGLSWQDVFETEDRDFVESYCREGEIEFRWKDDGGLWTRQHRPAVIRHPGRGDRLWFNQVDQWHPSNLRSEVAEALLGSVEEEDLPIYATFADGTPFRDEDLALVRRAYEETRVLFPWREGDLMVLDNMLVAHGRMPFSGPRKILVSMGEPIALKEVA